MCEHFHCTAFFNTCLHRARLETTLRTDKIAFLKCKDDVQFDNFSDVIRRPVIGLFHDMTSVLRCLDL